MKAFRFLSLCLSALPIWLFVIEPIRNPAREACMSVGTTMLPDDTPVLRVAETGSSSVTLNGVEHVFDSPPTSGGTVQDEGKYERRSVGGKDEYPYIKTGKRTLALVFSQRKNDHVLSATVYFDGKTGESRLLENNGFGKLWAGKRLNGSYGGKLRLTSLKKIEAYKYLMSGTFVIDAKSKSENYHFEGRFKDFVITDMEDPAVQKMIKKHTPAGMKKAADEMREDAKKRRN